MIFTEIYQQEDVWTNVQRKSKRMQITQKDCVLKCVLRARHFLDKIKQTNVFLNALVVLMQMLLQDYVLPYVPNIQTHMEIHQRKDVLIDALLIQIYTQIHWLKHV